MVPASFLLLSPSPAPFLLVLFLPLSPSYPPPLLPLPTPLMLGLPPSLPPGLQQQLAASGSEDPVWSLRQGGEGRALHQEKRGPPEDHRWGLGLPVRNGARGTLWLG